MHTATYLDDLDAALDRAERDGEASMFSTTGGETLSAGSRQAVLQVTACQRTHHSQLTRPLELYAMPWNTWSPGRPAMPSVLSALLVKCGVNLIAVQDITQSQGSVAGSASSITRW